MKAVAVIGMNYGDEGKGHITNFFSDENALNIRFNGGAQAAHAVFLSDGRNHIFHHFGSGSLQGARTLLASHFIVNPIRFVDEYEALSQKTDLREVFIDPRCRVSTHYDMLINAFSSWYHRKHDTCGIGINETIERNQFRQLRIRARDLVNKSEDQLKSILQTIENEYVPYRLDKLKLPKSMFRSYCSKRIKNRKETMEAYLRTIKFVMAKSVVWPDDNLIYRFLTRSPARHLVFEGAQGLLLDQHRTEYMPYLTRSSTGIKNVFEVLGTMRTSINLDVCLVTRTYLTRHGDGPLFNEFSLPHAKITEPANPENPYQGKMRYGHLNKDWYNKALKELQHNNKYPKCIAKYEVGVAMTCMDHINLDLADFNHIKIISDGPTEKNINKV